jgi:DinB family protein
MKYLMLDRTAQEALLADLQAMPGYLEAAFAGLSAEEAAARGPDELFAPVEQCWHLADLEREAFAVRIQRLLAEAEPLLPDFDGDALARERRYRTKSVAEGIEAFRQARQSNLRALRDVRSEAWAREGVQEGVGRVALCDLPAMMAEHDEAHRQQIEAWMRSRQA